MESGALLSNAKVLDQGQLQITEVTDKNAGFYICHGSNKEGSVTKPALLRIVDTRAEARGLSISPYPGTVVTATPGSPVLLRCHVPGQASLTVSWSRQDGSVPVLSRQNSSAGELEIGNVTTGDQGVYFCHVTTDQGKATEQINLKVQPHATPGVSGSSIPRVRIPQGGIVSVVMGENAQIDCLVTADPPANITWTRSSGRALPASALLNQDGTLLFSALQAEDEDQYVCTATNAAGSSLAHVKINVRTNIAPISSGSPRILLSQGEQMTVRAGESFSFECLGEGDPTPRLYWSRGTPATLERGELGRATYVIPRASAADSGFYQCTAHNSLGKAYKRVELRVRSRVGDGPEDELQIEGPVIRRMTAGSDLQLVCRSTDPDMDLHWSKKRGTLPVKHRVRNGVLFLYQLRPEHSGQYVCSATSKHGHAEAEFFKHVEVIVLGPPSVRISPPVVEAELGDSPTLICDAEGFGNISVKWNKQGGLLSGTAADDGYGYLEFSAVTAADAGRYVCEASNDAGVTEAVADLIVIGLPSANFASGLSKVKVGDKARLECVVSGRPEPEVRWEKDGGPLPKVAVIEGRVLSITSVDLSHGGRYSCTATNPSGSARAFVSLLVSEDDVPAETGPRPDVTSIEEVYHKTRTVTEGQEVTLGCEVQGSPPPTTRWVRDEGPLPADAYVAANSLTIRRVRMQDGGTYRCIATNQAGSVQAKITMIIQQDASAGRNRGTASLTRQPVSVGSDVTLSCDAPGGITPTWSKVNGSLPSTAVVRGRDLHLKRVGYADSGNYICHVDGLLQIGGSSHVRQLVVSDLIPYFLQEELSYMTFPPIPNAELDFDVEITFKPDSKNGLLLYQGTNIPGEKDFLAFGINNGHAEFRYDCGTGHAVLVDDVPVNEGEWCHAQLERQGADGMLRVNGREYRGKSPGGAQRLHLQSDLYVGGVPSFDQIPRAVGFQVGFRGAVSHIGVGGVSLNLGVAPLSRVGVEALDACSDRPCQNGAWCVTANQGQGYKCECRDGYTGHKCERRGQGCFQGRFCQTRWGGCDSENPCLNGGVCDSDESSTRCACPLGFGGNHCQHVVGLRDAASFSGTSYLELPSSLMPQRSNAQVRETIRFTFSTTAADGLMYWFGQDDRTSGHGEDFVSIAVKNGRVHFTYELGSGEASLATRSRYDDGYQHTVLAVRSGTRGTLVIDGDETVIAASQGLLKMLNTKGNIYLGGVPDYNLMTSLRHVSGFRGCMRDVKLMDGEVVLDLGSRAVSARDVGTCSGADLSRSGRSVRSRLHGWWWTR